MFVTEAQEATFEELLQVWQKQKRAHRNTPSDLAKLIRTLESYRCYDEHELIGQFVVDNDLIGLIIDNLVETGDDVEHWKESLRDEIEYEPIFVAINNDDDSSLYDIYRRDTGVCICKFLTQKEAIKKVHELNDEAENMSEYLEEDAHMNLQSLSFVEMFSTESI